MELVYQKTYMKNIHQQKRGNVEKEPEKHCFFFSTFWGKITSILDFFTREPNGRFFVVMYW